MTEEMIEKIIVAVLGPGPTTRQSHYLRESLRHLVRMAQIEREADVKRCVALSIGMSQKPSAKKVNKAMTRKILTTFNSRQRRLDFQSDTPG
jgi:hypothetical protein